MKRSLVASASLAAAILLSAPGTVWGGQPPIPAGSAIYEFDNTFFVTLVGDTPEFDNPFNDSTDPLTLPAAGTGLFTQVWEQQQGDTINDELTSIVEPGLLAGFLPFLILGGSDELPAELGGFTGSITNITQDPVDGSLASGDRLVGGRFAQVVPGVDGIIGTADDGYLYSTEPYFFEANGITGLPFPVDTVFTGTDGSTVDIKLALGGPDNIDPMVDPVVGQVLSGGLLTITAIVPEPSTGLLVAAAALARLVGRRS